MSSTTTTTTTSLPPFVKGAVARYTQGGKPGYSTAVSNSQTSSVPSAPITWDGKRNAKAKYPSTDSFTGQGRTVGAPVSTTTSKTANSTPQSSAAAPPPVVKPLTNTSTATSAVPISNIRPSQTAQTFQSSQWAGTGDLDGAQNIQARFKTATEVIRKLAKERSKSLGSSSRPSLPDSLTTLQRQESFTDAFVDDAAYVWNLSNNSASFKKRMPSVMRKGRRSKTDGYHRSVESESDYHTTLDQSQVFKDTGLKEDQKKKMSDILWRNPSTSLLIMEKMMERDRQQDEPSGSVSERLSSYKPADYIFGDGGYEEESAQIQANISACIASRSPASRTARADKLSSLSGHELVTAIAELGWTISEKHEMEVNELCGWGREIPALIAKFEADHRASEKLDANAPLDAETTATITENVKSLVYNHLKRNEGWDLEDVESLMAMWSVKDSTALNMGLRSIPKHAISKVEKPVKKSRAALDMVERQLSVYDDPYKPSSSAAARWL